MSFKQVLLIAVSCRCFALKKAVVKVRDGRWWAPPESERWMHLCPDVLDLGKGTSVECSQGEGRPCMWLLRNRAFQHMPTIPVLWNCKGRQEKQRYFHWLHRGLKPPWGKLQMLNSPSCAKFSKLCRVSWGQKLLVLVIPPIAQMESCAASLPVGTGARITRTLSWNPVILFINIRILSLQWLWTPPSLAQDREAPFKTSLRLPKTTTERNSERSYTFHTWSSKFCSTECTKGWFLPFPHPLR